jgi:hypothetical protein
MMPGLPGISIIIVQSVSSATRDRPPFPPQLLIAQNSESRNQSFPLSKNSWKRTLRGLSPCSNSPFFLWRGADS